MTGDDAGGDQPSQEARQEEAQQEARSKRRLLPTVLHVFCAGLVLAVVLLFPEPQNLLQALKGAAGLPPRDLVRWMPPRSDDACLAQLDGNKVRYQPLPARSRPENCEIEAAVRLKATGADYKGAFITACRMAAALKLWEDRVVQPAARQWLGQEVTRFTHYGSWACRTVRGGRTMSEHATARAIDISGFRLADGRFVTLRQGWEGADDARAFLRQVHRESCRLFSGVLGPDANALHKDHFHLDLGRRRYCR